MSEETRLDKWLRRGVTASTVMMWMLVIGIGAIFVGIVALTVWFAVNLG